MTPSLDGMGPQDATSLDEDENQNQYLATRHEAGHAVASLGRRRCDVYKIYIVLPDGFTRHKKPDAAADYAFILYAGPWAQARAQWTQKTIEKKPSTAAVAPSRLGMIALRAYLIVGALLLVVNAIQISYG
jgi:hypothetical protein